MKTFLAALGLIFAASLSFAAPVSFDLTGTNQTTTSLSQTVDDLTMTVTASGGNVRITGNGTGVTGTPEGGRLGLGESLTFTFSRAIISLTADIFENRAEDEDFGITIGGTTVNLTALGGANGSSVQGFDLSSFIPASGVTSFVVFGLEPDAAGNRGIKIDGITVSAVPLPASGLLILAALPLFVRRSRA